MRSILLNLHKIIKLLISILLFLSIFYIYVNDELKLLINPRYNIFILCAEVILLIIIIHLAAMLAEKSNHNSVTSVFSYFLFIFIVISLGSISYENYQSNISQKKGFDINIENAETSINKRYSASSDINADNMEKIIEENNTVVFEDKDFLEIHDKIYDKIDDYIGKPVKITGYVYRIDNFEENYFIISRLAMYCCAADAVLVGMVCDSRDFNFKFEPNAWFEIEGLMVKKILVFSEGRTELPVIKITSFSKIKSLSSPYVYPNF